ncbi:hypothetical protein AWB71_05308 [Caballeronia peredens]|nr:hypothetical protein AWB71_05308 [Caballeronia peredens]
MNNAINLTYPANKDENTTITNRRERIGLALLAITTGSLMGMMLASPPDLELVIPISGLVLVSLTVLVSKAEKGKKKCRITLTSPE